MEHIVDIVFRDMWGAVVSTEVMRVTVGVPIAVQLPTGLQGLPASTVAFMIREENEEENA